MSDAGHAEHPPTRAIDATDRHWAAAAHISALVLALLTSWFAGFAGVLGAGVVYLLKRDASAFVAEHAREALNFNLSMFIYAVVAVVIGVMLGVFTVLTLGIGLLVTAPAAMLLVLVLVALALVWLVCSIIAAVRALDGQPYRYPLTLRLVT